MQCKWAEERLSAYVDQEIDARESQALEEHVERCEHCRAVVTDYRAMGALVRRSEPLVDTDAIWDRISGKHAAPEFNAASIDTCVNRWSKRWGFSILAVAASIALLFFSTSYNGDSKHTAHNTSHSHAALAVDFKEVFRSAKNEPQQAIARLVSKYSGRQLSEQETSKHLGYEPAVFKSLPEGFRRVSTHLLNMPCCKCSASVCQRSDGSSLIVFEHKDAQPVWFGDLPSIETLCAGRTCKITESAGQLAVSWQHRDRQLTIVGANDLAELNQWVTSLTL